MIDLACYDEQGNVFNELYQWDMGRRIEVRGLEVRTGYVVRFNYTNDSFDAVYSVQAEKIGDNYTGVIPNEITQSSKTIILYAYIISESGEKLTVGSKRIWVNPRQRPADYEYVPTTSLIEVATGLIIENEMIYLARDGVSFGDGVAFGGGVERHEDVAMIPTMMPLISTHEIIEESGGFAELNIKGAAWEQGGGNTDTGELNTTHTTRIRSPEYFALPQEGGRSRSITLEAASQSEWMEYVPYFYTNTSYIVPSAVSWHTHEESVAIPSAATRIRFVLRFYDDRTTVPNDLTDCIMRVNI